MAGELSDLEVTVLRAIKAGRSVGDIAKGAGVPAATLGKTIATLQIKGLLNDDGTVSEKGNEVLSASH